MTPAASIPFAGTLKCLRASLHQRRLPPRVRGRRRSLLPLRPQPSHHRLPRPPARPGGSRRDHRFRSITEIWLDGDHYKWRAMRAIGSRGALLLRRRARLGPVRGLGAHRPETLMEPALPLDPHGARAAPSASTFSSGPSTAKTIFERCNERLQEDGFPAMGLLAAFRVAAVCTHDDPADSLSHHAVLAERTDPVTRVYSRRGAPTAPWRSGIRRRGTPGCDQLEQPPT